MDIHVSTGAVPGVVLILEHPKVTLFAAAESSPHLSSFPCVGLACSDLHVPQGPRLLSDSRGPSGPTSESSSGLH